MSALQRWLREPLVHFIAAGAILFTAFGLFRQDPFSFDESTTIVVDRRNLLTFLQYRANAFEPEIFGAALDAMTAEELQEVIDAYVNEEVLYREAKALGLEESDNIIRQRMVQKINFLLADVAATGESLEETELEAYFAANIEAYAIQPWATFTHIFFDAEQRGAAGARVAAEEAMRALNDTHALFNDTSGYGDRFPYFRNYVERTFEYIASQFGNEFAAEISQLEPSESEWRGPFRSAYGEHVVLLTRRAAQTYPELDEVRGDVERDYLKEQANEALAEMAQSIRERYRVIISDLRAAPGP
jgi:hypothetical protein